MVDTNLRSSLCLHVTRNVREFFRFKTVNTMVAPWVAKASAPMILTTFPMKYLSSKGLRRKAIIKYNLCQEQFLGRR